MYSYLWYGTWRSGIAYQTYRWVCSVYQEYNSNEVPNDYVWYLVPRIEAYTSIDPHPIEQEPPPIQALAETRNLSGGAHFNPVDIPRFPFLRNAHLPSLLPRSRLPGPWSVYIPRQAQSQPPPPPSRGTRARAATPLPSPSPPHPRAL